MSTSQSSVAVGIAALRRIVTDAAPSAAVFALLLALTWLWQQIEPATPPPRGIVQGIVEVQLERTETMPRHVDVLTVGDSSGLVGLDGGQLSRLLGAEVESLSTVAFVGPTGDAELVRRYLRQGGHAHRLLIVLHTNSLNRDFRWRHFENQVASGDARVEPPQTALGDLRARLLSTAEPVLYVPLPGGFGDFYGDARGFMRFIRAHNGTAIDPGPQLSDRTLLHGPLEPERIGKPLAAGQFINNVFEHAAVPLARLVEEFGAANVRLILMPNVEWPDAAEAARAHDATRAQLRDLLGLDSAPELSLPATLPISWFTTPTHLNREGRERFTGLLAAALAEDRARFPWPGSAHPMLPAAATDERAGEGEFNLPVSPLGKGG